MLADDESDRQAEARRFRSEAILRDAGVLEFACLPAIETADRIEPRSAIDIARRALCLLLVSARGSGLDVRTVRKLAAKHGTTGYFTKDEQAFLDAKRPGAEIKADFSWRSEASWVLLWALGFVDQLGLPLEQMEPNDAIAIVEENQLEGLASSTSRRSMDEVLDQADLIYRCHWAVRHSEMTSADIGRQLDPGVTFERHYALNWLIRYEGQEWDEITTDT